MTVFVKADQDQVPVVVNLIPQEGKKGTNGNADAFIPDFQENPDHPFNSMVKSLYTEAIQAYSAGDKAGALGYLNKATDLDPTQAQVRAFRDGRGRQDLENPANSQATPSQTKDHGERKPNR